MDVVAVLTAAAGVISALVALFIQLRAFRREIVDSVETHMRMTQSNHDLLEEIKHNGNGAPPASPVPPSPPAAA